RFEARERGTDFAERVTLTVGLPSERTEDFVARAVDLTAGRAITQIGQTQLDAKPQ
ncbi:MAG: DUF1949 domain-containing protein, partial [Clostridia bacterium]|nr:DUF1949 domain-containing protein [Clostridia bacterium]